jgi:hypothetical protein
MHDVLVVLSLDVVVELVVVALVVVSLVVALVVVSLEVVVVSLDVVVDSLELVVVSLELVVVSLELVVVSLEVVVVSLELVVVSLELVAELDALWLELAAELPVKVLAELEEPDESDRLSLEELRLADELVEPEPPVPSLDELGDPVDETFCDLPVESLLVGELAVAVVAETEVTDDPEALEVVPLSSLDVADDAPVVERIVRSVLPVPADVDAVGLPDEVLAT